MRFHVVTPCVDVDKRLTATVDSLARQTALLNAEYSIVYVIQVHKRVDVSQIEIPVCENLCVDVNQDDDEGLYDALGRGFTRAKQLQDGRADVYCYLGVGDLLAPHAFEIVGEIFGTGIEWLTGLITGYNDKQHLTEAMIPFRYRGDLIRKGVYGRWLPFIQQESTFWSARLQESVDWSKVAEFELAGDAYLWHEFASLSELVVVEAWLGGFETRAGQLSVSRRGDYIRELDSLSHPLDLRDRVLILWEWLLWHSPRRTKRMFDPTRLIYDESSRRYQHSQRLRFS